MGALKGVNYEDPLVKYRGERVVSLLRKLEPAAKKPEPDVAVDIYYTFFLPFPILNEAAAGQDSYRIVSALISSARLVDVKKYTVADSVASSIAAATILYRLSKLQQRMAYGSAGGEKNEEQGPQIPDDQLKAMVEGALKEAAEQMETVKDVESLAQSIAAGTGSYLSLEESVADVYRLAKNSDLRELLDFLKTFDAFEVASQSRRLSHRYSRGEVRAYELGGDIERLVPHELSLPEELFYAKLADSKLLLYEKVLPETLGPIYVLLDKSGSMMGAKILWAKAVALALARRAMSERRNYYIRFFDSIPYPAIRLKTRLKGRDLVKLLDYIARVKASGGTDITRAIMAASDDIAGKRFPGASDIILVTDGEDRIGVELVRRELKRAQARLISVMIQGDNPDLREASDVYLNVSMLSSSEALKVVRF